MQPRQTRPAAELRALFLKQSLWANVFALPAMAASYPLDDHPAMTVPPHHSFLHDDAADLFVAVPMARHGRFRRDRHRTCKHRGACQGKEELLHADWTPLAPDPFLVPLAQTSRHIRHRINVAKAIGLRCAAPLTSLTPVKSRFNQPPTPGSDVRCLFCMRKTG